MERRCRAFPALAALAVSVLTAPAAGRLLGTPAKVTKVAVPHGLVEAGATKAVSFNNANETAAFWKQAPALPLTPHSVTSEGVMAAVTKAHPEKMNRFAVNFGAGDGLCMIPGACGAHDSLGHGDPVYPLFHKLGYKGIAVEGNPALLPVLSANLPAANVTKTAAFITPLNTVSMLQGVGAPIDMDYFKNDIDAYDCAVLYSVLKGGYKPKVLQLEVNPEIPYPISFGVNYAQDYKSNLGNSGFYGCSLTLTAELGAMFGYKVVGVSLTHDIILVHQDILPGTGLAEITQDMAQEEESKCCLAPNGVGHFGAMSNYHLLNQYKAMPGHMLAAMQPVLQQSCIYSQGKPACTVPYTLSLNAQDFVVQYDQVMAANGVTPAPTIPVPASVPASGGFPNAR